MSTLSTHKARKMFALLRFGVLLVAGTLLIAPPARAGGVTYFVNSRADGLPSDYDFECTLREAIIAANGGASDCGQPSPNPDAIEFTVAGAITLTYDPPAVNDHLTINGGSAITIDGASGYRIFTVNGGKSLTLNDLVLSRAFAESEGGAILNPGILLLNGNQFQGNNADPATRGGAVWSSGPLIIVGGRFVDNQAGAGGAVYARREVEATALSITGATFDHNLGVAAYPDGNGGALLIDNVHATIQTSTFTRNGAQSGGAIYLGGSGVLTLTHSTLQDNSQTTNGAGLYNLGSVYLSSVTLSTNAASHGGGIDNFGLLFLTNVTLSGNEATHGGGLKNEGGTARLSNVTLYGNLTANGQGGGIMNTGPNTHLNLTNVIVTTSPTGDNCAFATLPDFSQWNLSSDNTCDFDVGRENLNLNLNLKLSPLANNGGSTQTHLPRIGSPAIDNSTDDDAPSIDQRGSLRPQGPFYDVGSLEVVPGEALGYLYLPLTLR